MDINIMMTNEVFTMKGKNTQSNNKHNILRIRQSCKPFGVIDESECFSYLLFTVKSRLLSRYNRVLRVLSCRRFPCVPSFRAPIALCNFWALKNKE